MSLKNFLSNQKRALSGLFAASVIFAGGMSTAQAAEKLPAKTPVARKSVLSWQQLQQVLSKVDKISLNIVQKKLLEREGNKNHLYFDTKGILHTGIGLNINNYSSFRKLDFITKDGKLLTERQKKAYFAKVKAFQRQQAKKGFNYKASYYAKYLTVCPTKESCDKLFIKRITDSMNYIKKTLGVEAYYNLHAKAQSEIIMMHYNMGSDRFNPTKWPKFFNAAKHANYIVMSKECHTKGVSEERNQQVANTFKSVANVKWFAMLKHHKKTI